MAATLTPIPASTRSLLEALSKLNGVTLAIQGDVTVAKLRSRVGVGGIWYVASAGLEVMTPDGTETLFYGPEEARLMKTLCAQVVVQTDPFAGVRIESGDAVISLNYLAVDPGRVPQVLDAWRAVVNPHLSQLVMTHTAWGVEARICSSCDERTAVRYLRRELKPRTMHLYFGNNPRVQEVMRDLRPSAIVIEVGRNPRSSPEFSLPDPVAVANVLKDLAAEWDGRRTAAMPPGNPGEARSKVT
jgi:trehalose-6-phosphatase